MANKSEYKELLDAGVHFGHLTRKWHPSMAPYIFMEKNGIHIIDLNKTVAKLDEASAALKQIAKSGKKILFVATKKQAKEIVENKVKAVNMPFVTERWPGGMLTNFSTIRKSIRKMSSIDKMGADGTLDTMSKRERLQIGRQREKLERNLGSIAELTRLPAALFVIDIKKEHIAISEARKLNIPTFAIVDTNSDPTAVDFPIPANDDASKAISLVIEKITGSIAEGLSERKTDKEKNASANVAEPAKESEEAKADNTEARAEKVVIEEEVSVAEVAEKPSEEPKSEEAPADEKSEETKSADEAKPKAAAKKSSAKKTTSKTTAKAKKPAEKA